MSHANMKLLRDAQARKHAVPNSWGNSMEMLLGQIDAAEELKAPSSLCARLPLRRHRLPRLQRDHEDRRRPHRPPFHPRLSRRRRPARTSPTHRAGPPRSPLLAHQTRCRGPTREPSAQRCGRRPHLNPLDLLPNNGPLSTLYAEAAIGGRRRRNRYLV